MPDSLSKGLGPNAKFIGVEGARRWLSTPGLLLDLDALDRNIAAMASRTTTQGVGLRPHSKGAKSIAIAQRQVAAGALGVCCATLGEAEVVASGGLRDLLITSAVVTDTMIDRLIALDRKTDGLMIVVDNPANLDSLAGAAEQAGRILGVLVDFDVGQGRTGVTSIEAAVALARRARASAHLAYRGVQAYYGHLQHVADYDERGRAARAQMARVRELISRLEAEGLSPTIVTGGGTGTFDIDFAGRVFTEIQAGSYPFMDLEYLDIPLLADRPAPFAAALIVQASVVSANRAGFAIVNGGYKSFATEGGPPRVASPRLAGAKYRFMGDEHGGVEYDPSGGTLAVGDLVEFLPPHCDPTINLYDRYHCVRSDTLVDIWPVDARGC
jgi:D-serine deaminase-like pyridoxal phosphate-dependent protein